jgi:hypothetical protein
MSRNFAVISKALPHSPFGSPGVNSVPTRRPSEHAASSGEYLGLVHLLFHARSAVALVPGGAWSGSEEGVSRIAETLAVNLAATGKRVVVVSVRNLLALREITVPEESQFTPGNSSQVWRWPSLAAQKIDVSKPRESSGQCNWLDMLRHKFDAVLLDCPSLASFPGVSDIAAMGDTAVLAVEAGRATKAQIEQDQRALRASGARMVGCILIQRT